MPMSKRSARRSFLAGMGTLAVGACGGAEATEDDDGAGGAGTGGIGGASGGNDPGTGGDGAGGRGPLDCTATADNIEGPYYRPGAPMRSDLAEPGALGVPVVIRGSVASPDCAPIAGAELDVWQADADGGYDNDGVDDPAGGAFILRGRMLTDAEGRYELRTIIPGHYLNGAQFRPAHIHVTVRAPGFAPLTTQLYFEGDPYNDIDPFIIESLIMPLAEASDGKAARFDFVLAPQ